MSSALTTGLTGISLCLDNREEWTCSNIISVLKLKCPWPKGFCFLSVAGLNCQPLTAQTTQPLLPENAASTSSLFHFQTVRAVAHLSWSHLNAASLESPDAWKSIFWFLLARQPIRKKHCSCVISRQWQNIATEPRQRDRMRSRSSGAPYQK